MFYVYLVFMPRFIENDLLVEGINLFYFNKYNVYFRG